MHSGGSAVSAASQVAPALQRPFVLLQGPIGGFYGQLARQITTETGIPVLKIQFNLGDVLMDRCPWTQRYTGRMEDLEAWYLQRFSQLRPRAVMGLGSQRPVHIAARKVCDALGIAYYSGEEGYVRPDYITIERGSNNAGSALTKVAVPDEVPEPAPLATSYGPNIAYTALYGTVYQIAMSFFGRPFFPRYRHHKERGLWSEALCWNRCFVRNKLHKTRELRLSETIARDWAGKYFVAALQVYDDLQLKAHGRGWTPERVISQVIPSFAAHAPKDVRLVIKQHPLEAGHWNYQRIVDRIAALHGVSDRVVYLRYADQFKLLHHAKGMVTINSTIGLTALDFGCPVLTFGDNLYARDGLAQQADTPEVLHGFWANPRPVDRGLAHRFRSFVIQKSQIHGDYYIPAARRTMAKAIVARLLSHEAVEVVAMDQAKAAPTPVVVIGTMPSAVAAPARGHPAIVANDAGAIQPAVSA